MWPYSPAAPWAPWSGSPLTTSVPPIPCATIKYNAVEANRAAPVRASAKPASVASLPGNSGISARAGIFAASTERSTSFHPRDVN